jgi:hypothetical protein
MNCAAVKAEATVVSSLITTLLGGLLPTTASSVRPPASFVCAAEYPPLAIRYRTSPPPSAFSAKWPLAPVRA